MNTIVRQVPSALPMKSACVTIATPPISTPTHTMWVPSPRAKMLSRGCRGGRAITSRSPGSAVRASPGTPSVTRLIQRMWIGSSGIGRPRNGAKKIVTISPALLLIVYLMNLRMLSKIRRPSRTAFTIVAKSSSRRIMSDASLETSVPVMPMATPMSARFSAGASFTPSPVIATKWPLSWSASTIWSFCAGATRA